jgi:hypothetical protein
MARIQMLDEDEGQTRIRRDTLNQALKSFEAPGRGADAHNRKGRLSVGAVGSLGAFGAAEFRVHGPTLSKGAEVCRLSPLDFSRSPETGAAALRAVSALRPSARTIERRRAAGVRRFP